MKWTTWAALLSALFSLVFAVGSVEAQQSSDRKDQKRDAQPSKSTGTKPAEDTDALMARRKARPATVPACADLGTEGTVVDKLFDKEGNPVFDLVDDAGKPYGPLSPDTPDSLWSRLIDCANQTHGESERVEALRVAAVWEHWRAESFAKQRREAKPIDPALIHPASCDNLDQLRDTVTTVTAVSPESASARPMDDYHTTVGALKTCVNEIDNLNKTKPNERYWATVTLLSFQLWEARRAEASVRRVISERTKQTEQRVEQSNTDAALMKDCDQIITVAALTPNGLALYIPREGQEFMAKNAKNYPRMCLVEDTKAASIVPSIPHYLIVWAYSESAFAGFQPVRQVTTAPVSGSGTLTNMYGDRWNFTYTGTLREIDTLEAPYVLQSRALYLNAYNEKGDLVSHHSITASSQSGGDAYYAAGYNAASLISLLWNNPSRFIKSVLKDVEKASGH
jgi:hypothetical protein